MKTMKLSCESIDFLGVSRIIPWENSVKEQLNMWNELYADGTMEELKKLCDANKVYGLLRLDDVNHKRMYQIVCENRSKASSDKYEKISINPSVYMAFQRPMNSTSDKVQEYEGLYEEIWRDWMPESKYEEKVNPLNEKFTPGYAAIEFFDPLEPESANSYLEVWVPVDKKDEASNN